ncbi:MAG TPA: septum formation family protein [Frankiaceae bacterium]|nr:septum formation family protein [Frankiaceae bacterium]
MPHRFRARALAPFLAAAVLAPAGCSLGGAGPGRDVSAFDLTAGRCLVPPDEIAPELSDVRVVPCDTPHTHEAFDTVRYAAADGTATDAVHPGPEALTSFAEAQCARRYEAYVGVPYAQSELLLTYLLPSVRGWHHGDRSVVCVVTTTGPSLTGSVQGTRR